MKKQLLNFKFFTIAFLLFCLSGGNLTFAQVTKTWNKTNGGNWTTASNWNPSGVPTATDHVLIPVDQSAPITRSGTTNNEIISLKGLTIDGNVNFTFHPTSTQFCTLNITGVFVVNSGKTFTAGADDIGRLDVTLASGSTGTVVGTVYINSYTSGTT